MILVKATEENFQDMRKIRNQCRKYMTRNNNTISKKQQINWFSSLNESTKPYLLVVNNNYVAYGIVKVENELILLTGGVSKKFRGLGYGEELFKLLILESKEFNLPIMLEVLKTNFRAKKLYFKLGFKIYEEDDKVFKMILGENS
jgi:hypothetical protein